MNNQNNIPFITTNQMREVDRVMIEKYGITLMQMMENAGRNLTRLAQQRFIKTNDNKTILIVAGSGGNGGGALVCCGQPMVYKETGKDITLYPGHPSLKRR